MKEMIWLMSIFITIIAYTICTINYWWANKTSCIFSIYPSNYDRDGFLRTKEHKRMILFTWVLGMTSYRYIVYCSICAVSLQSCDKQKDWLYFILAIVWLILWYLTETPLWSVIIISITDLFALFLHFTKYGWTHMGRVYESWIVSIKICWIDL